VPTRILGLSAYYHDSAACLVVDGDIVAAAQEERFTRKKHDAAFPHQRVAYCLREGGISAAELDLVGFYEKPLVKFERLLETYIAQAPRGLRSYLMAVPLWLTDRLWMGDDIAERLEATRARFCSAGTTSPRGLGVLSITVRGSRGPHHRRRRRVGHIVDRRRARGGSRAAARAQISALAGPAVFRVHLLRRLQGQLGRVQGHGARAIRRAEVRAGRSRTTSSRFATMAACG
jgi:hypothetical protein